MTTTLSKEDYLKRYLSGSTDSDKGKEKKKKKKKDKHKPGVLQPRMRIIDNDADVPAMFGEADKRKRSEDATLLRLAGLKEDEEDGPADLEEMPTIAAVEDERPEDVKILEEFKKTGKWKTLEGEDLTAKHIVNEVVKIEPKTEQLADEEEEIRRLIQQRKKLKKKLKKENQLNGAEIKEEPSSPARELLSLGSMDNVKVKHEPDSDCSPPRGRGRHHSSDNSPPRRQRHDSDTSPPRRQRHDSDASLPRRQRHDSDASTPRRQRHDSDASPPRRQRHDSDASPPRRQRHDSDASPPRRPKSDSDASPPRLKQRQSDSDASPPRRGAKRGAAASDSDASPPRQPGKSDSKMARTLDGKKAGLQRAADLKDELEEIRQRDKRMLDNLDADVSGRFAETKVRGRLKEAEEKKRQEKERKEVPEEIKEKFQQLNKGVAQMRAANRQLEDNLYEMSKPLTRTENDEDREAFLKEQEREEDPMLAYMRKKKEKVVGKVKKLPVYQGPQPPPNRFGIRPGYRWDGVVRTNGFEQKLLTRASELKCREDEAYQWSHIEY